jgi:hypothetical protein
MGRLAEARGSDHIGGDRSHGKLSSNPSERMKAETIVAIPGALRHAEEGEEVKWTSSENKASMVSEKVG